MTGGGRGDIIVLMIEYVTQAVVLEKELWREQDGVIYFFTEELGLVMARAMGVKKITSKLGGHLEPGDLVTVRLVEGKGTWVADALKERRLEVSLGVLRVVRFLASLWQRDDEVFEKLLVGKSEEKEFLAHFGFDDKFSQCYICGYKKPDYFELKNHNFICRTCWPSLKLAVDRVILIR